MTLLRKCSFPILFTAGLALGGASQGWGRESGLQTEAQLQTNSPPRSPGLSVEAPGQLLEDNKSGKLISDELLEARIAAAKASVAPTAPVAPSRFDKHDRRASAVPSQMPAGRVYLSSPYGLRTHPIEGGLKMHSGVDLAGVAGTPVYATADGVVQQARWFGSYGLFVELKHAGTLETRYGHLSGIMVTAGQRVKRGELVGFIGSTGNSTGPHLHYEVRRGGQAINPVPFLLGSK